MDLGQTRRPREEVKDFDDATPRKKCALCCAARSATYAGGAAFVLTVPCNLILSATRKAEKGGWRTFLNRNLLIALPLFAITFTHQWILSEFLWSKHKKTVWQVNWQSIATNIGLWTVGIAVCTVWSRRYLPARSRTYRLLMWDYYRTRRGCANPWLPSLFGKVTEDLDWYNIAWVVSMYHVVWALLTTMLEKEMGAHYAMFFRDSSYSRWCSPRWREWRELEVMRKVQNEQVVATSRWGSFLTNDRWRVRGS